MFEYIIKNLKIFGYHGQYEEERKEGQFFFIDVLYAIQYTKINDDINNVLDYSILVEDINKIFNSKKYYLLEELLQDMKIKITTKYKLKNCKISIKKKNPKIKDSIEYIKVTI